MEAEDGMLLSDDRTTTKQHIPVAQLAHHQKMNFLRKYYALAFLQFVTYAAVAMTLFLMPGVRGFVQQEAWCRWLILACFVVGILTSCKFEALYPFNYMIWICQSALNTLLVTVLSAYFDSEVPIQTCVLLSLIMLSMIIFCSQSKLPFDKIYASIASVLIAICMSIFVQVTFLLFSFDYVLNIGLSSFFSIYIHLMAAHCMNRFSITKALRANFALYIDLPKFFLNKFM